jgi:hypothetical protein
MLIIDPPATAGGTDPVQVRFATFGAKLRNAIPQKGYEQIASIRVFDAQQNL